MARDAPNPNADPSVHVRLGLGHPEDETLLVRVSPHAAAEMRELMEAEGVFSGKIMESQQDPISSSGRAPSRVDSAASLPR